MKKYVFIFIALLIAGKVGWDYLGSPDFQAYADKHNVSWTCRVNTFVGNFQIVMSNYDDALKMFEPVVKRCPKTEMAEEAEFKVAECLERSGHRADAIDAYLKFAEDHKTSRRAFIASQAANALNMSR